MSEVQFNNFAVCDTCGVETLCRKTDGDEDQCGGRYWAPITHAKHQSELAALREERDTAVDMIKQSRERNAKLRKRLTAAEQRNAELTTALTRAKLWVEDRRRFGDEGTIAEDWLMIERTLRGLPHPPTEFDRPTESGASE